MWSIRLQSGYKNSGLSCCFAILCWLHSSLLWHMLLYDCDAERNAAVRHHMERHAWLLFCVISVNYRKWNCCWDGRKELPVCDVQTLLDLLPKHCGRVLNSSLLQRYCLMSAATFSWQWHGSLPRCKIVEKQFEEHEDSLRFPKIWIWSSVCGISWKKVWFTEASCEKNLQLTSQCLTPQDTLCRFCAVVPTTRNQSEGETGNTKQGSQRVCVWRLA